MCAEPKQEITILHFHCYRIGGVRNLRIHTPTASLANIILCFFPWWRSWFLRVATPPKRASHFCTVLKQKWNCRAGFSPRGIDRHLNFSCPQVPMRITVEYSHFSRALEFHSRRALNPSRTNTIFAHFALLHLQKWASNTGGVQHPGIATPATVSLTLFSFQFLGRSAHSHFVNTSCARMPLVHGIKLSVTSGDRDFHESQKWHA